MTASSLSQPCTFAGSIALVILSLQSIATSALRAPQKPAFLRQVLWNHDDVQYYGNLTVGGQRVSTVYDTGSFELLVLASTCVACGDVNLLYKSRRSGSHHGGTMNVMHSYGSGTLYSRDAYDTLSDGPFEKKNAPFWEVYNANMPVLMNSNIQSIAGLAPYPSDFRPMLLGGRSNEEGYASIQDAFGTKSFAFCLGKEPLSHGYLDWNEKQHEMVESSGFSEVKLSLEQDAPHWTAPLRNVRLGTDKLGCNEEDGCGGIVDSGTSLIAVPARVAEKLQKLISNLKSDCSDLSGLPYLHFNLGGAELTLPPDSYVYRVQNGSKAAPGEQEDDKEKANVKGCKALVMTLDLPPSHELGDMWIFGMPFLRQYYTVFEGHPARLFVAEAGPDCMPKALKADYEEFASVGRVTTVAPRRINVDKVRWPTWTRRASKGTIIPHYRQSKFLGEYEPRNNITDDESLLEKSLIGQVVEIELSSES